MNTFQVKVIRYYTDLNGVILDPATVPLALQQKAPFYIFNLFDKQSGFLVGQNYTPPLTGMYFLYSYVKGTSYNFLDFQVGNIVNSRLNNGDLITVYADDPILPNYLCLIVLHSDYVSYAGFLENMRGRSYSISHFQHATDNPNNWNEGITLPVQDDYGLVSKDNISVLPFLDPSLQSLGFIDVTLPMNITDKKGVNSYMLFATQNLEFTFYIDSITRNTNNSNNNNNLTNNGNSNKVTAQLFQVR